MDSTNASEVLNSTSVVADVGISIVVYLMMLLIGLLIVLSNTLVIVAIILERHGLLEDTHYVLLSYLSAADLLVGLSVGQRGAAGLLGGGAACVWHYSDLIFSCSGSSFLLCVISINQYIAISRPLHYTQISTQGRVAAAAAVVMAGAAGLAVWVLADDHVTPVCTSFSQYSDAQKVAIVLIVLVLPAFTNVAVYWRIIRIVHRLSANRVVPVASATSGQPSTGAREAGASAKANDSAESRIVDETRKAKAMAIVVVLFIAMWSPYCVWSMATIVHPELNPSLLLGTLGILNSAVNPFIYTLRFATMRKAFIRVLTCYKTF